MHTEKNLGALKYPQVILGMIAIFFYVGTEVTIQSNLPAFMELPQILNKDHTSTVHFISMFWGSLMIGRWTGSIKVFNLSSNVEKLLYILVPFIAFGVIFGVNVLKGSPPADFTNYLPMIGVLIILFFITNNQPAKTLAVFAFTGIVLMFIGLFFTGAIALYALVGAGLFLSIMWPCIFALSIAGLGKYTNQASSLLIMMILGGAVLPPLQGYIGDVVNIQFSYIIPLFGFAYLLFYSIYSKTILKKQGIVVE